MGLRNLIFHVDWNQASIDSNRVCREDGSAGDYVQWDPYELCHLHDFNVIIIPDGLDFTQIFAAQSRALSIDNGQPTAVIYRTIKGWKYGIEGKASHGAGHKLCSEGFYEALKPLLTEKKDCLPKCPPDRMRCRAGADSKEIESCYWEALKVIRGIVEANKATAGFFCKKIEAAKNRLAAAKRYASASAPRLETLYQTHYDATTPPKELELKEGATTTLRGVLGDVLNYYNKQTKGAFLVAAADLLGSTSVTNIAKGFSDGYYHAAKNPNSRILSIGGICEDAMCGMLSGLASYGRHIGVGSSYGAFIAALGHIASRLHGIGNQARHAIAANEPYKTFILICAHAGLKTGEDGPTHADPQALQLLQGNFPPKVMITLTPWDPQEIWPLMTVSLMRRPAVIAPFVTRPNEKVLDRSKLQLAGAGESVSGVYALRKAGPKCDGTIVLQESGVTYAFIEEALPRLDKEGFNLNIFYVASAELFDLLPAAERQKIYPESLAREAMGITGFTLPTMHRWISSEKGRAATLHPFQKGRYLGSGQAHKVLEEAGLDGESQFKAIKKYIKG